MYVVARNDNLRSFILIVGLHIKNLNVEALLQKMMKADCQQRKDSKMKIYSKWFILSLALIGVTTIVGCNKPQEVSESTKLDSTVKVEMSDVEVTTKVKTALLTDLKVKSFDIAVVTLKGDVRLTGTVDNQEQLDHVDTLVRSVEGVHSIHDELTIKK
jgi:osmotically-inducible protein OsmY